MINSYEKLHLLGFALHSLMILIGFIMTYRKLDELIKCNEK